MDGEEPVMMPMRLHSLGDNLYLLYQLFRESSWQAYLEMGAYKLTGEGLISIDLFDTPDGLSSSLSTEITTASWDYELNDEGSDYWWIYYFDTEKAIIYHPVTEDSAITGEFIPYVWDGKVFAPAPKTITTNAP